MGMPKKESKSGLKIHIQESTHAQYGQIFIVSIRMECFVMKYVLQNKSDFTKINRVNWPLHISYVKSQIYM